MGTSQGPAPRGVTSASALPQTPQVTNKAAHMEVPQLNLVDRELGILTQLDPRTLDKKFEYRWVNKSPRKVARARAKGYVVVNPEQEPNILNAVGESPETAVDGTYTIGDVVLMKLPKLDHKARARAKHKKAEKRLRGPQRQFRKTAKEKGSLRGQSIEVITDKDPEQES